MKINRAVYLISCVLITGCVSKPTGKPASVSTKSVEFENVFEKRGVYSQIAMDYKGPRELIPRHSENAAVSSNGRRVVWLSKDELTPDAPNNNKLKLYTRLIIGDQAAGSGGFGPIELISRRPATSLYATCGSASITSEVANGDVYQPAISPDGTKVAFVSNANNLAMSLFCDDKKVPQTQSATGFTEQVYLLDLTLNTLTLVSGITTPKNQRLGTEWPVSSSDNLAVTNDGIVAFAANDSALVTTGPKKIGLNKEILIYKHKSQQIAWASYPDPASGITQTRFGSSNPRLSADGRYLTFQSREKLTSNDLTEIVLDKMGQEKGVADIYRIQFGMGSHGPDIDNRLNIKLISKDKTGFAKGKLPAEHPDMSSDGNFIVYETARVPEINGWLPNDDLGTTGSPKIIEKTMVYIVDVAKDITSLVSVAQLKDKIGRNTYKYLESSGFASKPTISPDGAYVLLTGVGTNDMYLNQKMADYREGKLIDGQNSCKNYSFLARQPGGSVSRRTQVPADIANKSEEVPGGWEKVIASECMPALDPNTQYTSQVYRVVMNLTDLKPFDIAPLSISLPTVVMRWLDRDVYGRRLPDGKTQFTTGFYDVHQLTYGNTDSVSFNYQLMSENSNVVLFSSAAGNFVNDVAEMSNNDSRYLHPDGNFSDLSELNIGFYFNDTVDSPVTHTLVPENRYNPVDLYIDRRVKQDWHTYMYLSGVNPIRNPEKF